MEGTIVMIQPTDIKTTSFKKGLFGYNKIEVDSFKDSVYKAYDDAVSENNRLSEENEKLKKAIEESRLKIFDLEKQVNESGAGDSAADSAKAKKIIEEAQKSAADIIARAKAESERIVSGGAADVKSEAKAKAETKAEPAKEDKASATSKFFKEAEEKAADVFGGDDDEVFVGEIEDNRKSNKVMIGDGEEEEDADFEFL